MPKRLFTNLSNSFVCINFLMNFSDLTICVKKLYEIKGFKVKTYAI